MVMSRLFWLGIFSLLILVGCQEEDVSLTYESTSFVQLNQSVLIRKIDWAEERKFLQSEQLYEVGAEAVGIDVANLKERVSYEIHEDERCVLFRAVDSDPKKARLYAEKMAGAYLKVRNDLSFQQTEEKLVAIDSELDDQKDDVENHRKNLSGLLQKYGLSVHEEDPIKSTLEKDRLTYEKAKKALEQETANSLLFEKAADK